MPQPLFVTTLFSFAAITSIAQFQPSPGAANQSLATATVAQSANSWGYYNNPGSLSTLKRTVIGCNYSVSGLLPELQSQALTAVIPINKGALSAGITSSGYQQFRYSTGGLGYSLQLAETFHAGVQCNVHYFQLGDHYGKAVLITSEAGFLVKINERWRLGGAVFNIGRQQLKPLYERLPSAIRIGSSFQSGKQVMFLFEVEKDLSHRPIGKVALEYLPSPKIAFRIGTHTQPTSITGGFGYHTKGFHLDFGTNWNARTGWSPSIGFTWQRSRHAKF